MRLLVQEHHHGTKVKPAPTAGYLASKLEQGCCCCCAHQCSNGYRHHCLVTFRQCRPRQCSTDHSISVFLHPLLIRALGRPIFLSRSGLFLVAVFGCVLSILPRQDWDGEMKCYYETEKSCNLRAPSSRLKWAQWKLLDQSMCSSLNSVTMLEIFGT